MKRHHIGLTLLLVASMNPAVFAQTRGENFAFLVACSNYDLNELRKLPYSGAEIGEFRSALLKTGFPTENIKFLHDRKLEDPRFLPEKKKILKELNLLLRRVTEHDTLLVALDGHGLQFKGERSAYFCPLDAQVSDKSTLIPLDGPGGLYEMLAGCKAQRKLLIVNACRNDPLSDHSQASTKLELADDYSETVPEGIAALYSCQKGQRSYYYDVEDKRTKGRERSLFYHHLIEAWQGKYAQQGAKVTIEHVFAQVVRKTSQDADVLFGRAQVPQVKRAYEGDWVITKAVPVAVPVPPERKNADNRPSTPSAPPPATTHAEYIWVHHVNRDTLQTWTDQLDAKGFRPIFVDGYSVGAKPFFSAVACKDGKKMAWDIRFNLTSDEYQKKFDDMAAKGYRPLSVSGYLVESTLKYAAVWVKDGKKGHWWAHHGQNTEAYRKSSKDHGDENLRAVFVTGYSDGTAHRFSSLFTDETFPRVSYSNLTSEEYQKVFDEWRGKGYRPICVSGYQSGGTVRYAAVFAQDDSVQRWEARHNLTPVQYQQLADRLTPEGYRPLVISGYTVNGELRYATIWVRERA
jgi:hypothetical protein